MNKDAAGGLSGLFSKTLQVVLKLMDILHAGLVLLAFDDDWNSPTVEQ